MDSDGWRTKWPDLGNDLFRKVVRFSNTTTWSEAVRILRAGHSTDIAHTMQPYVKAMLEEYDYIIVSPYMGVDQYEPFGERVIVDCCAIINAHESRPNGQKVWQFIAETALGYGLSVIVHNPLETGETALNPVQTEEAK